MNEENVNMKIRL